MCSQESTLSYLLEKRLQSPQSGPVPMSQCSPGNRSSQRAHRRSVSQLFLGLPQSQVRPLLVDECAADETCGTRGVRVGGQCFEKSQRGR